MSGPKKLRHEVATICSSGLVENVHFESISFSWWFTHHLGMNVWVKSLFFFLSYVPFFFFFFFLSFHDGSCKCINWQYSNKMQLVQMCTGFIYLLVVLILLEYSKLKIWTSTNWIIDSQVILWKNNCMKMDDILTWTKHTSKFRYLWDFEFHGPSQDNFNIQFQTIANFLGLQRPTKV